MRSKSVFTVILFYLMVGMLIISINYNMRAGFAASYIFYMITLMLFLGYTYRKINEPRDESDVKSDNPAPEPKKGPKRKGKSKRNN